MGHLNPSFAVMKYFNTLLVITLLFLNAHAEVQPTHLAIRAPWDWQNDLGEGSRTEAEHPLAARGLPRRPVH